MDLKPPPPRPVTAPALRGLLALAVLYTLYFARDLVLPVLVSVLLALLLAPLVGRLKRLRLPGAVAAGLVVAAVSGGIAWGVAGLVEPARDWIERAPTLFRQVEHKLRPVRAPVEEVRKATEQAQQMVAPEDTAHPTVKLQPAAPGAQVLGGATHFIGQVAVVVFLVYFLLSSGEALVRRSMMAADTRDGRLRVLSVARDVKHDVVAYLGIVTMINAGLGIATALAMWGLGMPNPALWGAMAALFNFMPYAGPGLTTLVLAVVGVLTFDPLARGLAPAGAFLLLANIEGNLITPTLVGRRLTLPPLVVFLSLLAWTWMWGVAGALLATPILVVFRVAAEHVPGLHRFAPFLGCEPRLPAAADAPRLTPSG